MQGLGPKSSVDDLCTGQGVVLGRAATTLRSIETQPFRLGDLSCQLDKSPSKVLVAFDSLDRVLGSTDKEMLIKQVFCQSLRKGGRIRKCSGT